MDNLEMRPVAAVSPAAAYIGGKKQLAQHLARLIATIPHQTYAEPFVGMGGVFLRRVVRPKAEVINDKSGDVATLFRVLQRHYVPFMDMLRFQFTSRREFERLMATDPGTLTDLERAVRFLYLQRTAFGGKVAGRNFGVSPHMPGRFDVTKLGPLLADINERFAGVIIENLDYATFIERYDSPETLFYLDPPYFGSEGDYGKDMFGRGDFQRLAEQLARIAGTFVLSINDTPEVRLIFAAFNQQTVDLTYTISGGPAKDVQELVITPIGQARKPAPQGTLF